jgi:transposase
LADEIHTLALQRYNLVRQDTRNLNKLHGLLSAVFPEGEAKFFSYLVKAAPYYPTPEIILKSRQMSRASEIPAAIRQKIMHMAKDTVGIAGPKYEWIIRELGKMHLAHLTRLKDIDQQISSKLEHHPYYLILKSFPGMGNTAAATLLGEIKDIDFWPNKRKFRKGLGVYSVAKQSASSNVSVMGREGSRHARRVLFQVALVCIGDRMKDNNFRDYYRRLVGRGKMRKKALVATMGKIAEIIYYCLKQEIPYERNSIYLRAGGSIDGS